MHKKVISLLAAVAAIAGLGLAVFIPAASASKAHNTYTEYCEYNEYTQYTQYQEYCETTTTTATTGSTTGSSQTILPTGGTPATPSNPTVKTAYPAGTTLVNVNLPTGAVARKFYLYTTLGVSFGVNHSYKVLKKEILAYNGATPLSYNITQLSRPHGRIHFVLKKPISTPTIKINKNVFEFTPREKRLIERLHIKKTLVTLQVTTTTGKVYNVKFRAIFGALVVVKFH